ncbi:hypothetical protein FSP39_013974 [Pinctada imbricata]|uniref:Uncharacterized protein n=1 Tax=Pinctada imbricata TaxID=66713 RepID=A0AA88Y4E2_PINIB|nr:hypothetical protein FSP39_013974 [Pinctada imbricata]
MANFEVSLLLTGNLTRKDKTSLSLKYKCVHLLSSFIEDAVRAAGADIVLIKIALKRPIPKKMPSTRSEQKVKKVTTKVTNTITGPSRTCRRSSNKAAPTKTKMDFAFKAPPPIFKSPVETRSRRSSMFGISNSKGGIRLNIAITPQDKKFVPAREKALSPPGVATRTRRSSIYVKGGKLNSLLKESQIGENQFELASKKVLSPPGMIRRTRRSSIYVKGGKFTGLLQPEA